MVILRPEETGLNELLDRILDKGVTVDANVRFRLSNVDLLGVKAHTVLASFRTAEKIGLVFPESTKLSTQSWRDLITKQSCPACGMDSTQTELKEGCPWCGWNYKQDER